MTDVIIAPRRENPLNDTEVVVTGGWFQIRPSKAYVAGGQWVQPIWSDPVQLTGSAVTVKLDPLVDIPYELYMELPNGRVGPKQIVNEFRIVAGAGPVGWETLTQVAGPSGGPVLGGALEARVSALEAGAGSVSGGASTLAAITNMSPLARLLNTDTTQAAMQSRLNVPAVGAAPTAHTHVATTDLTATGTKNSTTFLRGDNTWAAPSGIVAGSVAWTDVTGKPTTFPAVIGTTTGTAADGGVVQGMINAGTVVPPNGATGLAVFASATQADAKSAIGLSNVSNTDDLSKPVSVAQSLAINNAINTALGGAVLDSERNIANGVAGLDALGKLLLSVLPASVALVVRQNPTTGIWPARPVWPGMVMWVGTDPAPGGGTTTNGTGMVDNIDIELLGA